MKIQYSASILTAFAIGVAAISLCSFKKEEKKPPVNHRKELDTIQRAKCVKAMDIVNGWRGESPEVGRRSLKIVYWSPNDREPQPNHKKRLNEILLDIQKYYAREMERNHLGKLTLKFDKDDTGAIQIIDVKGKHPYKHYQVQSGREIYQDAKAHLKKLKIDADKETVVIFCNMSNWDAGAKKISQNSPYYAKGSSVSGTAWQVDSAILNLKDLTNMKDRVQDGQYGNITLGKYNTIFIGGIAHELGHAFGLPHNLETRVEARAYGIALMGSGNRAYGNELRKDGPPAFLTQASALKLATHPMFSGITKEMHKPVSFGYEGLQTATTDTELALKGKVNSTVPSYAVVAFVDPDGGSDYDATTFVAIPEKDGSFLLKLPKGTFKRKSKKGQIRLVTYFANGASSSLNWAQKKGVIPYSHSKDDKLELGPPRL